MNIFFLDRSSKRAAELLYRKHLTKMIVESTQLLCNAIPDHMRNDSKAPKLFKQTHMNHPCSVWVRESMQNFGWLFDYTLALCERYTKIFEKRHKCEQLILDLATFAMRDYGAPWLLDAEFTDPPSVMPDVYKISDDVVLNYRCYYIVGKSGVYMPKKDLIQYKDLSDFFDPSIYTDAF